MDNTKDINLRDIIYISKIKNRNINKNKIIKAYKYAEEKHKDQKRKSGQPYIIHPLNVAYILAKLGLDTETICAALLHDVVEDTDSTYNDIKELFGTDIANIVEGVTKLSILFKTTEKTKAENYKKMFIAMEKDIRVIILKLADRLHNIMTLEHLKRDRQIAISKETIELYAPIANKLGMYDMKVKLEDGAFKYLYPEDYINIKDRVNKKITNNDELLKKTKYKIEIELKKQRIYQNVVIDTKSLYCVYKNITENDINFDEIKDLFRIKIITNRKQECYKILGIINKMYFFLPGSFKDFIATPKNNKYQAIEEIVIGENGIIFELEICTFIMDKIDKYGITAYFPYFNYYGEKEDKINFKENLSGIYDSLELEKIIENPKGFLKTLKDEILDDEIYVFTPKGDIKVLPKDSTAIDFAYSIHTNIGNHINRCIVNSISMPFITKLKTGNIVEIETGDKETNFQEEWLKEVKTAKAKTNIMKILNKNKDKNIKIKTFKIVAKDRDNLALDITNVFSKNKVNIENLEAEVDKEKAYIKVIAQIKPRDCLLNILNSLDNLNSIEKAYVEK